MTSSPRPRVALVTGSSRGLGATIAATLAKSGHHVAVNGMDTKRTEDVAASIRADGGHASAFVADVTDPKQVADLVSTIESQLGHIEILVLNATGPQPDAPIDGVSWADHLQQLDFFVKSPVLLGAHVIPTMRTRRFGRIVHIDSEIAHSPLPGRSAYATAKNAQIGLAMAWARELAPDGITVNTVAPGFIPVERHTHLGEAKASYTQTVPVGRIGVPDDIAHAVTFFASEEASFITGQRMIVDGGRSLNG